MKQKRNIPKLKITIFLDNDRYQRNYEVQEYALKLGITFIFLPYLRDFENSLKRK